MSILLAALRRVIEWHFCPRDALRPLPWASQLLIWFSSRLPQLQVFVQDQPQALIPHDQTSCDMIWSSFSRIFLMLCRIFPCFLLLHSKRWSRIELILSLTLSTEGEGSSSQSLSKNSRQSSSLIQWGSKYLDFDFLTGDMPATWDKQITRARLSELTVYTMEKI